MNEERTSEKAEVSIKPIDLIRRGIQKIVGEDQIPTEGFESTMTIYGGRLAADPEGRMVYDIRGLRSRIDRFGDPILRTYDEHTVKDSIKLLRRHPRWFVKFLMPGPKRYRGTQQEILANIQRLGLDDYYGPHPWGIEIRRPELFTHGIPFQDILKADLVNSPLLKDIDRFQALAEVAKYMRYIHDSHGAIGEGVPYRFIFQTREGNTVRDPILFIPDVGYNAAKHFGNAEQKAIDFLELLFSTAAEELRRSQDTKLVERTLDTALQAYGDIKVIRATSSFGKRGRLSLEGLASQHNRIHLGFAPSTQNVLRQSVVEACQKYLFKND